MIETLRIDQAIYVARRMRDADFREVMATRWDDDHDRFAIDSFQLPGVAWAATDGEGLPVAIGGVAMHTPGVGTAWLVATDDFPRVALSVTRHVRRVVARLLDGHLNRIHAFSAAFHADAHRWMSRIGMRPEATLKAFGKRGEDFVMYVITRED